MSAPDLDRLETALSILARDGALPAADWPDDLLDPQALGLSETDTGWVWSDVPQVLDPDVLTARLPGLTIDYRHCIDSTNTQLLQRTDPIAGRLCIAELQMGGRGRRGRSWLSPYARNLAMSVGQTTDRDLADLGGLSSVIGVALARALQGLGASRVRLKWPNDVLLEGRGKLCGILVELQRNAAGQAGRSRSDVVAGIGVNVSLTKEDRDLIDQPVADLRDAGVAASRTDIACAIASEVCAALEEFEQDGFSGFIASFNELHHFHERTCQILQGEERVVGVVKGIGAQGQLLLETERGPQAFHGGEVSLRDADSDADLGAE